MWALLAALAIFMWVMSRRNKKRQADAGAFRRELGPGQRVMTLSGLVGVISKVEGDVITIASASGHQSEWLRRAIRSVVPEEEWTAMTEEYPEEPEDQAPDTDAPDGDGESGPPADPDQK
jgi:preprotein translocase subunit YajC